MPLANFMSAIATTERLPAPDGNGKIGARATWLEDVNVTPVMLNPEKSRTAQRATTVSGLPGVSVYVAETYTESHAHTKDGNPVTELPDIRENDLIIVDGDSYIVRRAAKDTVTSAFGNTLYIYLDEDNT